MARTWILLRGLVRESRHWEGFPQTLARHFPEDAVHPVDLPGNGSLWQQRSPLSIAGMVDALRRDLGLRGLHGPYHVIALSLGAMTAVHWLHHWPEEVRAAMLINTSASSMSPFHHRLRPANYGRILFDGLLARERLRRERTILELTTNLLTPEERELTARRWAEYAESCGTTRANALRQLWAALRFRAPAQLPGSVPVLVLNGGQDRLVDPACSAALARAWGLPLRVHPRAGHDLTLDDAEWVNRQLLEWLETRPARC